MKSIFKFIAIFALLVSVFSFAPKITSSESMLSSKKVDQTLTLLQYNITLTNPTGWYLAVWVTTASSTGAVELKFTGTITEPNGTVLSGLHFVFYNLTGGTYTGPATGYEYQLVVPVSESGYPAGSSVSNISNVTVTPYTSFP